MHVWSHKLASATAVVASVDLFTVPAGDVWIIKDMRYRASGAIGTRALIVDKSSGPALTDDTTIALNQMYAWTGFQVFEAGETLQLAIVSGTWQVRVSGYKLPAP